jgi:GDP-D-mannose dehydratase
MILNYLISIKIGNKFMKTLITGISGFAGSHLAEFLIEKGYEVFGIFFDKSTSTFCRNDSYILSLPQEIDILVEVLINDKNLFNIINFRKFEGRL